MRILIALAMLFISAFSPGHAQAQQPKSDIGARLVTVTPAVAQSRGLMLPFGVLVEEVRAGGPAAQAGLQSGDVIQAIDGRATQKAEDVLQAIAVMEPGANVRLSLLRASQMREATVRLAAPPAPVVASRPVARDGEPVLLLDTGGHMGLIKGMAFTHDGRQIVTAGDDKVIRVWDWSSGRTVRTIRGDIGTGNEGKLFALALSPAERGPGGALFHRWLAVGGFLAPGHGVRDDDVGLIRIYDFQSGRLVKLLKGHDNIINGLAFSRDGRRLISGSADRTAIIWDVPNGRQLHQLEGHKDVSYAVAFTPDGQRAITGSNDSMLKLWHVESGKLIADLRGHLDEIRSVGARPGDGNIYSGAIDGVIKIWDGKTGKYIRDFGRRTGTVGRMVFSADGRHMLTTCGQNCRNNFGGEIWDVASGKQITKYYEHDNIVIGAAISPNGQIAATGGGDNMEIHVWDLATGQRRKTADGKTLTLAGTGQRKWSAAFSADGKSIAWGSTWKSASFRGQNPLEFKLRLPDSNHVMGAPERVSEAESGAADNWLRLKLRHDNLHLAHRRGGQFSIDAVLELFRDGKPIHRWVRGSSDGYQHRAYTFTPDGQTIISAGDGGFITAFDTRGKQLGFFSGHVGDVWSVATSPDGRLLVSSSDDQTVRIWNVETRELIVSLFHGVDGEWVMWTPQGYYSGSANAEAIVGWNVNRGEAKEAGWVTAEQMRGTFFRPDVVERALAVGSATRALQEKGLTTTAKEALVRPLPQIRVIWPALGATMSRGKGVLTVAVKKSPAPPTDWRISNAILDVNAPPEITVTPRKVALPSGHPPVEADEDVVAFEIPLRKGQNLIKVAAINENGPSLLHEHPMWHPDEGELDTRGTLHVLAVGVDRYPDAKPWLEDLRFAGHDAREFAKTAAVSMKGRHRDVRVETLCEEGCTARPTRQAIVDALGRIAAAGERDTVVVFMAGHGESDQQKFYFLPSDLQRSGADGRNSSNSLAWEQVEEALGRARGAKFLFIDACRSGSAFYAGLLNSARQRNVIAFSSAGPNESAWEDHEISHGLFTYYLMRGLKGEAADRDSKAVSVYGLGLFLSQRVPEHAARRRFARQAPIFASLVDSNPVIVQH